MSVIFLVTAIYITHPSQRETNNNIKSTRYEKASKVVRTRRYIRQQNGIPDNADKTENDTEQTPALHTVGHVRRRHVGGCADKVARHCEELDLCYGPLAEIVDDGG